MLVLRQRQRMGNLYFAASYHRGQYFNQLASCYIERRGERRKNEDTYRSWNNRRHYWIALHRMDCRQVLLFSPQSRWYANRT